MAACAGGQTGGNDNITCSGNNDGVNINTIGGEDRIVIQAGGTRMGNAGDSTIAGGQDNDVIRVNTGSTLGFAGGSSGTLEGDAGEDLIVVNGSDIGRDGDGLIHGGTNNDIIRFFDGSRLGVRAGGTGTIDGGAGADQIVIDNGIIGRVGTGVVNGGTGEDLIRIRNGSYLAAQADGSATVSGEAANDQIIVEDSIIGREGDATVEGNNGEDILRIRENSILGSLAGSSGVVDGGSDNDLIAFDMAVIGREGSATVTGSGGDDEIRVRDGSVVGSLTGGNGTIMGATGNDLITINGATLGQDGTALVQGGANNDIIQMINGSVIGQNAAGSGTVEGNDGDDIITALDTTVGGAGTAILDGGADSDTLTLGGTTHLNATSMVLGGTEDDRVNLFDTVTADAGATLDGGAGTMDNLVLDGSGTGLFDGTITQQNFEMLTKQGSGTWTWTQDAAFSEGASIDNGVFELNAILTANTYIDPLGTLSGTGEVIGNVDNDGTVSPAGPGTIGTLTFTGDYDGGGVLMLDTVIGASGSPSDSVVITGTVSGVTMIGITDFGGGVPQLTGTDPGDGILLVDVSAGSTNDDDFVLAGGPIDIGFFRYDLSLEADNNWYLQSMLSPAGLQAGEALAGMLSAAQDQVRSDIGIAHNRVQTLRLYEGGSAAQMAQAGDTQLASLLAGTSDADGMRGGHGLGVWIEGFGRDAELDPKGIEEFDQTTWGGQIGIDGEITENLYLGVVGGFASSDIDFDGADGDIKSYTLGAYAAYIDGGFYIDGVIKGGWLDFDASSGGASKDYDGWLAAGAVKTGYGIALDENFAIEPNAGLTWVHVDHDDFSFGGVSVDEDSEDSLQGRLGLRLSGHWDKDEGGHVSPFIEVGVNHEFMGDNEIEFTGVEFESDMGGTSFDVGGGIAAVLGNGVAVSASVTYTGGEHIEAIQGNLGIGVRF